MADKGRVARYQADRTNQKFYFCRIACKQAGDTADKQLYQAYCETAIFHLQGALWAFLQELARTSTSGWRTSRTLMRLPMDRLL